MPEPQTPISENRPRSTAKPIDVEHGLRSAMEIVLQWLDELDDAVFAFVLASEKLRRRCFGIGAAAAVAVAGCSAGAHPDWVPLLGLLAVGSVATAVVIGGLVSLAEAISARSDRVRHTG